MAITNSAGNVSIETSNLDGETALKQRSSLRATAHIRDIEELSQLDAVVRCEPPNPNLHYFEVTDCVCARACVYVRE